MAKPLKTKQNPIVANAPAQGDALRADIILESEPGTRPDPSREIVTVAHVPFFEMLYGFHRWAFRDYDRNNIFNFFLAVVRSFIFFYAIVLLIELPIYIAAFALADEWALTLSVFLPEHLWKTVADALLIVLSFPVMIAGFIIGCRALSVNEWIDQARREYLQSAPARHPLPHPRHSQRPMRTPPPNDLIGGSAGGYLPSPRGRARE